MNTASFLTIIGFYTLFIIGGIYYYEDKIKNLIDYSNVDFVRCLDQDNIILQGQIKALKLQNAELKAKAGDWERAYRLVQPIQYESTGWKSNTFNSAYESQSIWQDELDLEQ